MTHSPDALGSRWLGELESDLARLQTNTWSDGQASDEVQPLFDGVVDLPILVRGGLDHVLIGNRERAGLYEERRLSITRIGSFLAIDVGVVDSNKPQPVGSLFFQISPSLSLPVEGLPVSAQNHTLLLDTESGEGSFVAHNPGPDGLSEVSSEVPFDANLLSQPLNSPGKHRASAALTFATEMVTKAAIAQRAQSAA